MKSFQISKSIFRRYSALPSGLISSASSMIKWWKIPANRIAWVRRSFVYCIYCIFFGLDVYVLTLFMSQLLAKACKFRFRWAAKLAIKLPRRLGERVAPLPVFPASEVAELIDLVKRPMATCAEAEGCSLRPKPGGDGIIESTPIRSDTPCAPPWRQPESRH